jgi:two-component system sensor histidine kinase BaeS
MPLPAPPIDRRILWLFAAIVVGGGAVTFVVTRQALAPLRDLRTAATRLADGDLRVRVAERGAAEFVTLARAFNGMAGRLEDQERLKRALTNDVAHELRTPLTNLRCHLEALADGLVHADASGIAALQADVRQLERLVDDLGLLAQADTQSLPLHPEAVDVAALARDVAREVEPRAAAAGLAVGASTGAGPATAWVDPGRIRQVMANLVENAIAHTPAGGRLEIRVARMGNDLEIAVADTGEGIGAEHLPHVFDRFYRADPSRSRRTGGVGLGLAIARQLVVASGGRIEVESRPGAGTTFRILLPGPGVPGGAGLRP